MFIQTCCGASFVLHIHNHKFGTEINVLDSTTKKAMNKSIVIDLFIANLSIFKYTYLSCSALFAIS
ncbi:hypothetical protein EX301_03785 [Staphylococcus aureus]|nr:hypothetical protein [Staphylococcus aureus]NAN23444.1 hypothetical protein [Staphylococcus aureus]PZG63703.1 hypothetical protein C7R42_08935 [Staphylococcus aureus]PZG92857.1 hypothetical protein C7R21_00125 [Staphylococcus aureus]PZI29267.1 hypothetical protein C7R02_07245 [Staphylococcus aureus]